MESASAKALQRSVATSILGTASRWSRKAQAFTLVELLCVVAAVTLLALIACLTWTKEKQKRDLESCQENLSTLGQVYQIWFLDFQDHLPWQVPVRDGGSSGRKNAYEHYQVLSNYLKDPKLFVCPRTRGCRTPSLDMAHLRDSNVSYAIGIDASDNKPLYGLVHPELGQWIAADFDFANTDSADKPIGTCSKTGGIRVDRIVGKVYQEKSFNVAWSGTNHVYGNGHIPIGCVMSMDGVVFVLGDPGLRREMSRFRQDEEGAAHILKPGP